MDETWLAYDSPFPYFLLLPLDFWMSKHTMPKYLSIYLCICVRLCCIDVDVSAGDTDSMTRWIGANDGPIRTVVSFSMEKSKGKNNTGDLIKNIGWVVVPRAHRPVPKPIVIHDSAHPSGGDPEEAALPTAATNRRNRRSKGSDPCGSVNWLLFSSPFIYIYFNQHIF